MFFRHQTKAWIFAFLALAAGCGGSGGQLAPIPSPGPDALSREEPEGGAPGQDAEPLSPHSPLASPHAGTEPDASPPNTAVLLADAGVPTEADAGLAYASRPDAKGADAQAGDAAGEADGGADPEPATVVLLPDTQYYSSLHPDIFPRQTRWIAEQYRARHIDLVVHVGDLVDVYNDASQWQVASSAMHALDGLVPYTVTTGNHDTDVERVCPISENFVPTAMPWIAGTMEPGKIENNFSLVDIGPTHWLVLALEWGPRDVVMTWADQVLKTYPDRLAMIVTHAYLYSDGNRYELAVSGLDNSNPKFQWFIPQVYDYTGIQGINDGESIWQKLVVPNPNVRLVFSGHANGATRLTSSRPDGSLVHQVLSDYQGLYSGTAQDLGGSGYLRIMDFDFQRKAIRVQTYSPYLDSYLTDDANQFSLSLER